ncbi:MAG TPA: hypothetical protein VHM19_06545 [Polyangiales bacterium]|nr:hypothetical protein [Polyangiales bacterium]
MDIILAPDVYVNASVALGSPPEQVVRRVLGKHKGESKATDWILTRVSQMLKALPAFKGDAVDEQIKLIQGLVQIVKTEGDFGPDAWEEALVAAAKAAGAKRVVTDHPDLLQMESSDGIDFVPTEAWLVEVTTPPPPPAPPR